MSRPDKNVISIQTGKTTHEQVRFQHEKHLRTFIICSQLDSNAPKPQCKVGGWSRSRRKARVFRKPGGRGEVSWLGTVLEALAP